MDSHKTTVVALSLSVLTLAIVSTFLSLNQSGVLGDTTSSGQPNPPRLTPTLAPRPPVNTLCQEVNELFANYCLKDGGQIVNETTPMPTGGNTVQPFVGRDMDNSGRSGICSDLYKLTTQFCPKVSPGPKPSTTCKFGVNSFEVGVPCKTTVKPTGSVSNLMYTEPSFTSAKYSCYDGTTGEVKPTKLSCASQSELRDLARKACEGHSICKNPEKPTGRPEEPKHCTGNKDCEDGEYCLLPPRPSIGPNGAQTEIFMFGKCVPSKLTVTIAPRVTTNPKITPKVSLVPTRGTVSCDWCGTNCVLTRPGLKCPLISAPVGKGCTQVGNNCKIVDLKD